MGQKINPIGFRLVVNRDWSSRWFASRPDFAANIKADHDIRTFIKTKLKSAAVSRIVIERAWASIRVTIYTARPGIVIGRKGQEIETLTEEVAKLSGGKSAKIDIIEIKRPELEAQLVAENIAMQMERRISFRRAMKRSVQVTMEAGALGVKIRCAGRLTGGEIARIEVARQGTIPLHTLRTPIDYGFAEADTKAGKIGIKCWICKAETMEQPKEREGREEKPEGARPPREVAPVATA